MMSFTYKDYYNPIDALLVYFNLCTVAVVNAFKSKLHIRLISRDRFIPWNNSLMSSQIRRIERLIEMTNKMKPKTAKRLYKISKFYLKTYSSIHNKLENLSFYKDLVTQELSETLLEKHYVLEAKLRHLSFSQITDQNKSKEVVDLEEFATSISQQTANGCY